LCVPHCLYVQALCPALCVRVCARLKWGSCIRLSAVGTRTVGTTAAIVQLLQLWSGNRADSSSFELVASLSVASAAAVLAAAVCYDSVVGALPSIVLHGPQRACWMVQCVTCECCCGYCSPMLGLVCCVTAATCVEGTWQSLQCVCEQPRRITKKGLTLYGVSAPGCNDLVCVLPGMLR
jgi:hypothetical protein